MGEVEAGATKKHDTVFNSYGSRLLLPPIHNKNME